ncbi:MAG TPA: dNTP triphosphohydrolase, partial [candidate division Zixibacteria bacterium]|nr:dNTP triphosphohydrolase [candidate division Zixibacteria bacterium]
MLLHRELIEQREREFLAPYAMKAADSRGRVYPLTPSRDRTCFQRDHDRIVHSKAFRRMEYKTQVFVYSEGDHYRTRLTHSMEVAQVCRSVARILGLNSDLSEAVALSHDLGHPPFGHAGEQALNELLDRRGGFNHNEQTLRVVDYLERRYPDHPGLNLSFEVREGIARHESEGAVFDAGEFPPDRGPTLEAAIVDVADGIAYNSHDVDDGLASGSFTLRELHDVPLCQSALEESRRERPDIDDRLRRYHLIRTLVGWQIEDLTQAIHTELESRGIETVDEVRKAGRTLAA